MMMTAHELRFGVCLNRLCRLSIFVLPSHDHRLRRMSGIFLSLPLSKKASKRRSQHALRNCFYPLGLYKFPELIFEEASRLRDVEIRRKERRLFLRLPPPHTFVLVSLSLVVVVVFSFCVSTFPFFHLTERGLDSYMYILLQEIKKACFTYPSHLFVLSLPRLLYPLCFALLYVCMFCLTVSICFV